MKVLITGGAGYIGSSVASALEDAGHTPIILDSLVNGRIEFAEGREFFKGDIADKKLIKKIFKKHPDIEACLHCAALIVIPESVANPYQYYKENVAKTLELLKNLNEVGCGNIIFSSSASVYDIVPSFKVDEKSPLKPTNPYARTKFIMEMVIEDFCKAYDMRAIILRYFNPMGADPKMRSGGYIKNPSHVSAKITEAILDNSKEFNITGTDYKTRDGSGIRDYVHIWDLARAHVLAIIKIKEIFENRADEKHLIINLGTGNGVTVFELVSAFEKVLGKKINKKESPRRAGDIAGAYADATLAKEVLGWESELDIEDAVADSVKWMEVRKRVLGY